MSHADGSSDVFGKSEQLLKGSKLLVEYGIVKKTLLQKFDLTGDVYYADINWTNLMKAVRKNKVTFTDISKFPPVSRDLALLVDHAVTFKRIEDIAFATEKKLLKRVVLFDVYEGKNLESGKKSYAVNFILQDENKTLTDKQIDKIMSNLVRNFENQLGAKLR